MDWIDCFPIFVLVSRLEVLFGDIWCIIVVHLIGILEIILKNAWQLLYCASGK